MFAAQTHIEQAGNLATKPVPVRALPQGTGAYNADQSWWNAMIRSNYSGLGASRAQLESYYRLLPPLARGHLVPGGYPVGYGGLLLQNNTLPRIVALAPGNPMTTIVAWTPSGVPGAVSGSPMKLAAFVKAPGTVEVVKGVTWFNPKMGVWASYAPHILFNDLFQQQRIRLDPTSGYATNAVKNWQEEPMLRVLLRDAIVVAAAIAGAYALAPLNGTASASLASTTVTAGAAPTASTTVADTLPASVGTPISTVSAPVAVGAPVSVTAAGTTAAAGATSLTSAVSSAVGVTKDVVGATVAVAGAKKALSGPVSPAGQDALVAGVSKPSGSLLSKLALPAGALALLGLLVS